MRVHVRFILVAVLACASTAVSASAAQAVGVEKFVAVNCSEGHEGCAQETKEVTTAIGPQKFSVPTEPTKAEAEAEGYVQAGGHIPYGITDFEVANNKAPLPDTKPLGVVNHIRTDVAPGLTTNPFAVAQCKLEAFGVPGGPTEVAKGVFLAPTCTPETEIGVNKVTVYVEAAGGDVALEGVVYNLEPREGLASEFGVALSLAPLGDTGLFAHTLIEGNVEWGQQANGTGAGDYHDYFEINVSEELPLLSSRLVFKGRTKGPKGEGDFLTNATSCPGNLTSTLKLTGTEGTGAPKTYTSPIGLDGCGLVGLEPSLALTPSTTASEEPDGIATSVGMGHHPNEGEIETSQLKTATITLPEGMTLNPSAAAGLATCTPAEARIHSSVAGTSCPAASELGTVSLEVPTLPAGSLTGHVYLGGPESGPITKPPYTIYVDAESAKYAVSVRVKGEVTPNESTGQVVTTFSENPEQPFTSLAIHFKEGALAPIANPLSCGTATANGSFTPYSGTATVNLTSAPFSVTGCASPIPFSLSQSTSNQTTNAGASTSFTFNLGRPSGDQYLSKVSTVLPEGLVGEIPAAKQCSEAEVKAAEANTGGCSAESALGTATVLAGAGPTPYSFSGQVYLTGPYDGAPYGLAIVVPATAGPPNTAPTFALGNVVTRATININPETTQVTIASTLPTIYAGIPLRVRNISIAITKQGFMLNPTNCTTPLETASTLTSTTGATQSLKTAFPVTNCSALAFKPTFGAKTSAKTSKANGASLETTLNLPGGDANVQSAVVQLPLQLPSRLTTLQKACPEATFAANPYSCPSGSFVGGARANTPTLPNKLIGPAILVSHGGEAFPDLDLVLEADNVRVILVGHTKITKGITTTDFATTPDAPVTSITVNLPIGSHSALTNYGQLCPKPLVMPTTVTGQNGVVFKQNTIIKVAGCAVRIVGHKVVGNTAYITVQTFAAGRVSGSGKSLSTVYEHFNNARKTVTLKVPLSGNGRRRGKPFKVKLRVGFLPKQKGLPTSASFATLTFR